MVLEPLLLVVVVLAAAMAAVLWRVGWRLLRRQEVARPLVPIAQPEPDFDVTYRSYDVSRSHDTSPRHMAWSTLLTVVAIFVAVGAGSVYALYDSAPSWSWSSISPLAGRETRAPLELVALAHHREANGDVLVSGLVASPTPGTATRTVSAVVDVFDRDGRRVATHTALLGAPRPADSSGSPGSSAAGQSPFVVRVPGGGTVERLRIGFRGANGEPIAHLDRRSARE